jgi:putative tricarboxylic transport membrane protein
VIRLNKQANIWLGIVLLIIAIFVIIISLGFPSFISFGQKLPGPNFIPVILSIILIISGSYEILRALFNRHEIQPKKPSKEYINNWGNQNVIIIILGFILYIPIVQKLGFVITTFIFSLILMVRLKTGLLRGIIISAILVTIIMLLFTKLFRVPLPEGIFSMNF